MLGGAGTVRVAAPATATAAVPAQGPGTLTLTQAQAQQMGLISPRKVRTGRDGMGWDIVLERWGHLKANQRA